MRSTTILSGLILVLFCAGAASAGEIQVLANAGYFQPSDKAFKDVYGGGAAFGGDVVYKMSGGLAAWAGFTYFSKTGEVTVTLDKTTLRIVPFFAGLRYYILKGSIQPYAGAAVGDFTFSEKNPIGKVSGGKVGFLGQLGLAYVPAGGFRAEIYGRFSSCKAKPVDIEAQIGGLQGGVAVGWAF